ncbi:hypothetical protein MRB53_032136 [Persea americana]|uniref:Uncharacterized protein n=1 Tax=Persea americana TaxID=3435 RepID=A0ACC2KR37_PERAE|nr:hypothetical protein MRB53_032136 [Persea americana]
MPPSAKGEECSRGGSSVIASDAGSSSTERRSIVSESSLNSAKPASQFDCDEVMRLSSTLARIRGVYASSLALLAPRSVASTGSSVGCPSSSEVSKSNISNHARVSRGLSGKGKTHKRRSSRSDCDLWRSESPAASSSSEFLNKTEHLRDTKDPAKKWLSQKVRQCGKVVGIIVDKNKGGWESLLAFAHNRDKENKQTFLPGMCKEKGQRGLRRLECSVNYESRQSCCKETKCNSRHVKRSKGSVNVCR